MSVLQEFFSAAATCSLFEKVKANFSYGCVAFTSSNDEGNSFTVLSPQKTELIMNNVNSYPRKRLGGKSPIAVFKSIYGEAITEKLGLKELSPKDVSLKPSLIQ